MAPETRRAIRRLVGVARASPSSRSRRCNPRERFREDAPCRDRRGPGPLCGSSGRQPFVSPLVPQRCIEEHRGDETRVIEGRWDEGGMNGGRLVPGVAAPGSCKPVSSTASTLMRPRASRRISSAGCCSGSFSRPSMPERQPGWRGSVSSCISDVSGAPERPTAAFITMGMFGGGDFAVGEGSELLCLGVRLVGGEEGRGAKEPAPKIGSRRGCPNSRSTGRRPDSNSPPGPSITRYRPRRDSRAHRRAARSTRSLSLGRR